MPVVRIEAVTDDGTTVEVEVDRPTGPVAGLLDAAVAKVRAALEQDPASVIPSEPRRAVAEHRR